MQRAKGVVNGKTGRHFPKKKIEKKAQQQSDKKFGHKWARSDV